MAEPSDPRVRGRADPRTPGHERPRERLALRGAAGLTSAELIGLVWGSGTRGRSAVDLATDALARARRADRTRPGDRAGARGLAGIGEARAAQLVAAFELGRRLLADWPPRAGPSAARTTWRTG